MQKIKIRLPATITNLGPGLTSLGLALSLYSSVEIKERTDESLVVETEGEGAGRYSIGLRHPVMLAMMRMFQHVERAPLGINVKVSNAIPLGSGLGAEAAFMVAGVIGANNLMGSPYPREQLLETAARILLRPNGDVSANRAITPILGGLTASILNGNRLIYRALPLTSLRVVVVLPELDNYARPAISERIPATDMLSNINRVPLLTEALRTGDVNLLAQVLDDKVHAPLLSNAIPGYKQAVEAGKQAGAPAVIVCGDGPALLAFADGKPEKINEAMQEAFQDAEVKARGWVLPMDTQGVVISVMQSA
jgi:homoserine kinase